MLKEEQAAELLLRCERIAGHDLPGIRGRLSVAEHRAAAVWEMLVIEAASCLGTIEYEPLRGGSPDIRLRPAHGRDLWIEAAYLYPRFWQKERQSDYVCYWVWAEADRRGILPCKIKPYLDGDRDNQAGPVRALPQQHERKEFVSQPEIVEFFEGISAHPDEPRTCALSGYTLSIAYSPEAEGPFVSSGGLPQEAPRTIKEHSVYRVLTSKAKQHSVSEPVVACVGSDQSPALRQPSPGNPGVRKAVEAAFSKRTSLAAAMIFHIDGFCRRGKGEFLVNPRARVPLTQEEAALLCTMNLNRWKYTFPLPKWEEPNDEDRRRVTGEVRWQLGVDYMEIRVPASLVVDALAGKTSLPEELQLSERDELRKRLEGGWVIEACTTEDGNLENGEDRKLVLRLTPPPESVFWPARKAKQTRG